VGAGTVEASTPSLASEAVEAWRAKQARIQLTILGVAVVAAALRVAWLERACDEANAELPPLKSFVLPGGTPAAAQLHVCRTVCRRAERRVLACGEDVNAECVRYLNRLSDLLFILGRVANPGGDVLWRPGYRSPQAE